MEANTDQNLQEKIDLYLDGSLNQEELQKFGEALKNNPALIAEIEKFKVARSAIKNYAFREKLKTIHEDEIRGRKKMFFLDNYSSYLLKTAASVVLLIVGVAVFRFATLNSKDLYAQKYVDYKIEISRGDDQAINNLIVYNYINGNFQDLIHIYESKGLTSNQEDFLAGSSFLKLKVINKAIGSYNKVITKAGKGGEDDYLEDAEYYIGLAYLQNKQVSEAYWFFSKIYHDSDHLYHDKMDKIFYWKLKSLKFRNRIFKRYLVDP